MAPAMLNSCNQMQWLTKRCKRDESEALSSDGRSWIPAWNVWVGTRSSWGNAHGRLDHELESEQADTSGGKMFTDGNSLKWWHSIHVCARKVRLPWSDTVCCWQCPVLGTASLDSFFYSFCNLTESIRKCHFHRLAQCSMVHSAYSGDEFCWVSG